MSSLSRRDFFAQSSIGAAVVTPALTHPPRAWIIVAIVWNANDAWQYPAGTSFLTELYYERAVAERVCRQLCDEFFTATYPTPAEFQPDWQEYGFLDQPNFDATRVTWPELQAAGFPDPFFVQELTVPVSPRA